MSHDSFEDRRKALENSFFAKQDQALIDKMRAAKADAAAKEDLKTITGIQDDAVLSTLVAQNVNSETLAALSLAPLVFVAWADEAMENTERDAILKAATERGIHGGDPAYQVLDHWLQNKPGPDVKDAWKQYVTALVGSLDANAVASLKSEVIGGAEEVAKAAGGILGIKAISDVERKMLDELSAVFG